MAILVVILLLAAIPIYFAVLSDKGKINSAKYIKKITVDNTEITPTKQKKHIYKKLSGFGKFIWFGMYASIWVIIAGLQIMSDLTSWRYYGSYDQEAIRAASIIALTGFAIFIIFFVCSFFDGLYCEYKYEAGMEKRFFSVSGRISRLSYLKYSLFCILTFAVLTVIPGFSESNFRFIVFIVLLVLRATAAIRRAQDCGGSIWVYFIPIVSMILYFCPGDKDANDYGPVPTKDQDEPTKITKNQRESIEKIKIEIVNNRDYISLKKNARVAYLHDLKSQISKELANLQRKLEAETNKLNDVPADIAKYVKPADNSGLKRAILELGNKMIAVDELIKSETTTSTEQMKPFECWKY